MTLPRLEDLNVEDLEFLASVVAARKEAENDDAIAQLIEKCIIIEGKKGRGKTLSAVALCYQMRERFGRHIIAVGSKMGLKKETFGEFQELTIQQFRDALVAISEVSSIAGGEANPEVVQKLLLERGVDVLYATIVFDESYQLFDCRTPSDKLVRAFGYFGAQQRHYHCTTILLTPDINMLDRRIRRQVDWIGNCFHNAATSNVTLRLSSGLDTLTIRFNGADDSLHPAYYDMYNTHALVGYRTTHLDVKHY